MTVTIKPGYGYHQEFNGNIDGSFQRVTVALPLRVIATDTRYYYGYLEGDTHRVRVDKRGVQS